MWNFNVAPAFMDFFVHFSKVKKTQTKRKRKKGTNPLESLYIFGVHRFFFTFRSCWNPSGFSDSILRKKKVPTPWNPYTILGPVLKSDHKVYLSMSNDHWSSFTCKHSGSVNIDVGGSEHHNKHVASISVTCQACLYRRADDVRPRSCASSTSIFSSDESCVYVRRANTV